MRVAPGASSLCQPLGMTRRLRSMTNVGHDDENQAPADQQETQDVGRDKRRAPAALARVADFFLQGLARLEGVDVEADVGPAGALGRDAVDGSLRIRLLPENDQAGQL